MEPTWVGGGDALPSAKHLSCDESISGFEGAEKMHRRCVRPVDEGEWKKKKVGESVTEERQRADNSIILG